jgi:hypothetical protein
MSIPESQLEIWSHQGSVTQSTNTYATIKHALEDTNAQYPNRNFEVYLQGSYGNYTNIFDESDVDVVICYKGAFFHDLTVLPADQQSAFRAGMPDGTYWYSTFKGHVQTALEAAFGHSVKPGKKAIKVPGAGSRRNADVLVAFEYRRYYKFNSVTDQSFETGISFFTDSNTPIHNYPKQHSQNCTIKHQQTYNKFKPLVRIFKNIRSRLVDERMIGRGIAPSYFIEGLLYNVPAGHFTGDYEAIVFNVLNWLHLTTDRTTLLCANQQFYLIRDNSEVCWPVANAQQFISSAILLWNRW